MFLFVCLCLQSNFSVVVDLLLFINTLSDGGGGMTTGSVELEFCPCGGPHSWLVPAMLSPPESLLMSCVRRGNFMEAHQVSNKIWMQQSAYLFEQS